MMPASPAARRAPPGPGRPPCRPPAPGRGSAPPARARPGRRANGGPPAKPPRTRPPTALPRPRTRPGPPRRAPARPPAPASWSSCCRSRRPRSLPVRRITRDDERRCLRVPAGADATLCRPARGTRNLGQPFLRRLTDVLPELPDWERRQLLSQLRDAGAVRLEKREGEPHPSPSFSSTTSTPMCAS
ncbi:MAG: hypothetical protein WKG07_05185 [Hymenobacter sp.]